jgi:hypothetical protein
MRAVLDVELWVVRFLMDFSLSISKFFMDLLLLCIEKESSLREKLLDSFEGGGEDVDC